MVWLASTDEDLDAAARAWGRLLAAAGREIPRLRLPYGRTWNFAEETQRRKAAIVRPFDEWLMAQLCIVSQPGTLIRRSAWEALGGVDESLHMAMDYDLWWRLYKKFGKPAFVNEFVAVNREHRDTKTSSKRAAHYREAMAVVRKHYGRVPLKWWLAQPYAVWYRSLIRR